MHGETGIDAAETGDEIILKCGNRFLCGVGAVDMRREELKSDIICCEKIIYIGRAFIVHDVHFWLESSDFEVVVKFCGCFELFASSFVF